MSGEHVFNQTAFSQYLKKKSQLKKPAILSSTIICRIAIFDEQIQADKNPETQIAKQKYFPEGGITYANKKHHH